MTSANGALRGLREANAQQILDLLRVDGSLSRAELSRRSGLSRTTVSSIVSDLISAGQVRDAEDAAERARGRRGGPLTLMPALHCYGGVDITRSTIRMVLCDRAHQVLASQSASLDPSWHWTVVLDVVADEVRRLATSAGVNLDKLTGVGLGVPGPVIPTTGIIGFAGTTQTWVGVEAGKELAVRLGVQVEIDSKTYLGCLAESIWGAARDFRDVIYIEVSEGLAAGLILDGRVYRGSRGLAGKLGHFSVNPDGPACACGGRGCLQTYVSSPVIVRTLEPVLGHVSISDVIEQARSGHRASRRVLADCSAILGRACAGIANLLDSDLIVIGGDLASAGDLALLPMKKAFEEQALRGVNETRVVAGELGLYAGAHGAAALAIIASETP